MFENWLLLVISLQAELKNNNHILIVIVPGAFRAQEKWISERERAVPFLLRFPNPTLTILVKAVNKDSEKFVQRVHA